MKDYDEFFSLPHSRDRLSTHTSQPAIAKLRLQSLNVRLSTHTSQPAIAEFRPLIMDYGVAIAKLRLQSLNIRL
jgi:hypothetical protein